jgi:putative spermidine/putrescine transport system permease protein
MTSEATAQTGDANATVRRISRDVNWNWLGVAPFFLFAFLFLIGPVLYLVAGAFQSADGAFTFDNIIALGSPNIVASFWLSIRLSLVSAGLALMWLWDRRRQPAWYPALRTVATVGALLSLGLALGVSA